jgi:hypothetical protein
MIDSGIPGLNSNAIQYVYKNLMIDMNDDDSSNAFKKFVFTIRSFILLLIYSFIFKITLKKKKFFFLLE